MNVQRFMLKSKIHRARVTEHNVDYEGSITIDEALMEAADLLSFEQVHIYNVTNGNRFVTYVIKGQRGTGVICINGAAAHKARKDDVIIIAGYGLFDEDACLRFKPNLVYVDQENRIVRLNAPD